MTFDKYLEEIGDVGRPLVASRLTGLANLSSEEKRKLAAAWPGIPAVRKERIARLLIELAEDNVELDFEEVFRLCLDDANAAVRVAGLEGLSECEERWLIDRLIVMVRDDESEEARSVAAEALGRFALMVELGDLPAREAKRIDDALLAAFDNTGESVDVRRRALESLSVRSTDTATAAIRRAYASDQLEMRLGAIYAMGRSADEQWLNTIVHELSSQDPEMRYEAATALGELEDERAVPYLAPLLRDDDMQVRLSTIASLGQIGGRRAKEELLRCQRHPDEQIRDAAEEALEELSSSEDPFSFGFGDEQDSRA